MLSISNCNNFDKEVDVRTTPKSPFAFARRVVTKLTGLGYWRAGQERSFDWDKEAGISVFHQTDVDSAYFILKTGHYLTNGGVFDAAMNLAASIPETVYAARKGIAIEFSWIGSIQNGVGTDINLRRLEPNVLYRDINCEDTKEAWRLVLPIGSNRGLIPKEIHILDSAAIVSSRAVDCSILAKLKWAFAKYDPAECLRQMIRNRKYEYISVGE